MKDEKFEVGNVVYLKSGSPRMTVTEVYGDDNVCAGYVRVTWMVYGTSELRRDEFPPAALKAAEEKKVYARYDDEVPY